MGTDRIYRFLFSFLAFIISILLLTLALGWTIPLDYLNSVFINDQRRLIMAILAVLGISLSFFVFRKGIRRKTIKQAKIIETSLGKVKIGLTVLENMANRVADQILGIRDAKTRVKPLNDGIVFYIQINLAPDTHVPETTTMLQNNLHDYFQHIVGLEIKEINILVANLNNDLKSRVE